jgi:hypothetical protein
METLMHSARPKERVTRAKEKAKENQASRGNVTIVVNLDTQPDSALKAKPKEKEKTRDNVIIVARQDIWRGNVRKEQGNLAIQILERRAKEIRGS